MRMPPHGAARLVPFGSSGAYVVAVADAASPFRRWRRNIARLLNGQPAQRAAPELEAVAAALQALAAASGEAGPFRLAAAQVSSAGHGIGRVVTAVVAARVERPGPHQGGFLSTGLCPDS
jgi:hypothetical protein